MADPHSAYARFHRLQGGKGLGLIDDKADEKQPVKRRAKKVAGRS
jgi:ATP-binding cassette subfamily B protein